MNDVVNPYLAGYMLNHRPKSVLFANGRLAHIKKALGGVVLSDLTDERIKGYIRQRQAEKVSGRTINMELGELSRAIGRPWSLLWPKVRKLEERKDVGRALSHAEQKALLDGLRDCPPTFHLAAVIPLLMLTGMRVGEALSLTWEQVDLMGKSLRVGRAKTSSGTGRTIPLNDDLTAVLAKHRLEFIRAFGEPDAEHYIFAAGSPLPTDPTRPVSDLKHGWETLRKPTGVSCRLHDLRHTFATRLAENGVPESTMLALMGHMSRAMLERYSHVRIDAKREAVAGILLRPMVKGGDSEAVPVKVPVVEPVSKIQ